MPTETSTPASAIVISVTTKMPLCEANQAAWLGWPSVAKMGWKNSSDSTEP